MLKVGDHAPGFSAQVHTGERISLSDFSGKTVVLWFFPKADTPGCTTEGEGFRDLAAEFEEKNAVVLGISFDPVLENRAFAKKYEFPFLLVSDTEGRIALDYHAAADPDQGTADRITYVIGPDGIITHVFPKVDVKNHASEILALL